MLHFVLMYSQFCLKFHFNKDIVRFFIFYAPLIFMIYAYPLFSYSLTISSSAALLRGQFGLLGDFPLCAGIVPE